MQERRRNKHGGFIKTYLLGLLTLFVRTSFLFFCLDVSCLKLWYAKCLL